jgi:hypothetical protein
VRTAIRTRSLLAVVILFAGCTAFRDHRPRTPEQGLSPLQRVTGTVPTQHDEEQGKPRPDRPDAALLWRNKSLVDENGVIDPDGLTRAKAHVDAMRAAQPPQDAGVTPASWTSLGPGNYGGRIRSFLIDPADPNRMFIGSVSGGIWMTTTGGTNWSPINDFMANLAVASMVMSADATTMYAGTGEGFFNGHSARGAGVFKSIDRGVTWSQLPSYVCYSNFK